VTIPQAGSNLLNDANTYALCYAESDGSVSDSTWRDSYVRVLLSKVETLSYQGVPLYTSGQLAVISGLEGVYTGSLASAKWISLVESSLNSNFPCQDGTIAAQASDTLHSGSIQATGKSVILDMLALDALYTFAVCYAENIGTQFDAWHDSGIRIGITRVSHLQYGPATSSFPQRMWIPDVTPATNRLPQVQNVSVTYFGALGNDKWLSFVDASLNSNNPCVAGSVAAAAADTQHSGALQASSGTDDVTIPQSVLLDDTKFLLSAMHPTLATLTTLPGENLIFVWLYLRFMH
jgi:hypothetical protein